MSNSLKKFMAFFEKDLKIALSYKFNLFVQVIGLFFMFLVIFFAFKDSEVNNSSSNYL